MAKIMFNDKYGLTEAVLKGKKTQTRRLTKMFNKGDIVDIAQRYSDVDKYYSNVGASDEWLEIRKKLILSKGWNNKMFVKGSVMPHKIEITNVREERISDITDGDCLCEGIIKWTKDDVHYKYDLDDGYEMCSWSNMYRKPRAAYKHLIDKMYGPQTWEANPIVYVYEFKLIK